MFDVVDTGNGHRKVVIRDVGSSKIMDVLTTINAAYAEALDTPAPHTGGMTGLEHYKAAERWLYKAEHPGARGYGESAQSSTALAQVHFLAAQAFDATHERVELAGLYEPVDGEPVKMRSHEYRVEVITEGGETDVMGFITVSGLRSDSRSVVLSKGVMQGDSRLIDWHDDKAERTVVIEVAGAVRFTLTGAVPQNIVYSDLDAGSNTLLIEQLRLTVRQINVEHLGGEADRLSKAFRQGMDERAWTD